MPNNEKPVKPIKYIIKTQDKKNIRNSVIEKVIETPASSRTVIVSLEGKERELERANRELEIFQKRVDDLIAEIAEINALISTK